MINRYGIKEKAEKLNIPFKNLLSAAVSEIIVELLANGNYCNELYLCNYNEFREDYYRNFCVTNIYYEYVRDLDEKMAILYMRDILKEIMVKATMEGFAVNGSVDETGISLKITVDDMYIPLHLYFKKHQTSHEPEKITLNLIAYENRVVDVLTNPKEEELTKHLFEIIEKLELINDMDHYLTAYEILISNPINGRKVKERLQELLVQKGLIIDNTRINMLEGYGNYTYMKKKWKVELRQKKQTEPSWEDVNSCVINFLKPLWEAMEKNMVFLGDWMPQLKRFLD
jgi:hypothetical protein